MSDLTIQLKRRWSNEKATLGELFLDNDVYRQCYTLEDVVREEKIPGETAIPAGTYQIILAYSQRFLRVMPRLLNVPEYESILIHSGNTDKDTRGCILVGRIIVNANFIGESRVAFNELFDKLDLANRHGKIWITITNETANV